MRGWVLGTGHGTLALAVFLAASLGVALTVSAGLPADGQTLHCRSVKVIDGDTLVVEHQGEQVTIHLAGVEVPSLDHPWGVQARHLVKSMVRGEDLEVTVVRETEQGTWARVVVSGRDLSALLAQSGLATASRGDDADSELAAACEKARDVHTGMWTDVNRSNQGAP